MTKRSRNIYYKLPNQYVLAKLNIHAGVPIRPATTRALRWSDRYYASHTASDTKPKTARRKRTKRLFAKHTKALKQFNKSARHHKPTCNT